MKTISAFFRICISAILFVVALGFAVSNTAVTELKFWGLDFYWRAPLVVFLLIFFAAGVALGILAVAPTLFKQRREVGKLKKQMTKAAASVALTPAPALVGSANVINATDTSFKQL